MPLILDENATCMGCGYRLANLPTQRCPECGRWFEPNDPTTYDNRWCLPQWRRWANAPSSAECWILISFTLFGVLNASGPAQWESLINCFSGFVCVPVSIGIGIVYFSRVAACWRDRLRAAQDQDYACRRPKWRWLVMPMCLALVASTFIYPWPLMVRFSLSRIAFDAAVKDYQAGRRFSGGKWIGLYYVDQVEEIEYFGNRPPSVFFITGSSIADPVGFTYDPLPSHPMTYMVVRVGPSWYTYED